MMEQYIRDLPLVAILRGITPDEVEPIGDVLFDAGFRVIEVPLNSPQPLESIRRLSARLGDRALIGAGTVLSPAKVTEIAEAGGRLVVSPHGDTRVIHATVKAGLVSSPGVATPTEGFAALEAGSDGLKLFPAEQLGPKVVKAWRAVFPKEVLLMPVGGITPDNMATFIDAGANGFGLGSSLYKTGMSVDEVRDNAERFAQAWQTIRNRT